MYLLFAETEDASNNYSRDDSCGGRSTPFLTPDQSNSAINQAGLADTKNGYINGKSWRGCGQQSIVVLSSSIQRRSRGEKQKTGQGFRQRNNSRDMRLLHTMIIILSLFVITTVPLGVILILSFTETNKRYLGPTKYFLMFSLLNSLINPWVYFWRFSEMRTALSRSLCCRESRKELNRGGQQGKRNQENSCCIPGLVKANAKKHTPSNSSNTY